MRATLILAMLAMSLANAGWNDYEEVRDLSLEVGDIGTLVIAAGAGSLDVAGIAGLDEILVTAIIQVPGKSEEKAKKIIASDLVLTLQKDGDSAVLNGYLDSNGWSWGDSPSVRLEVCVPENLMLDISDSSGSILVNNISGDIVIDDSSGSIEMNTVGGSVNIDDGSGSILVTGVAENVRINDGSGSIVIRDVNGSVTIEDGSGSVTVKGVGKDLIITASGSGSVNYSEIEGAIYDES